MKELNLDTPCEDGIRAHFGNLLSPDTEIEIIPHTRVWATASGVLLWDPTNGYIDADFLPKPVGWTAATPTSQLSECFAKYPRQGREPKVVIVGDGPVLTGPILKTVIYLTGPPASGKTSLVSLMADAVELNRSHFIGFTDLSRNISKHDHHATVVITSNDLRPQAFNVDNALRIWCRERKIEYLHINLTQIDYGN